MVHEVFVQRCDEVESAAVQIIPHRFIDRPEVFFVHHFAQYLYRRGGRGTVFGIESVDAAAAGRGGIVVVLHRVDLLVGASVVHTVAFGLHLVAARAVEGGHKFAGARSLGALVRRDIIGYRRMVAQPFDRSREIGEVEVLVLRVFRVARHPELLPYQ